MAFAMLAQNRPGYYRGGREGMFSPRILDPTPRQTPAPAPKPSVSTQLSTEVYKQRTEADKKREEQKKQALLSLQKGIMSESQYQNMMTGLQVDVEHGTERATRGWTESAYGQTNIGQVKAGAASVRREGRETLARGRRDIGIKRQEMAADVGRREADIHARFQVPRMAIPSTFTEQQALTAMTGETPDRSTPDFSTRPSTYHGWNAKTGQWEKPQNTVQRGGKYYTLPTSPMRMRA